MAGPGGLVLYWIVKLAYRAARRAKMPRAKKWTNKPRPWSSVRARTYRDLEPTWFYTSAGLFGLMATCWLAVDDRLFNGVSVWSKPFKFAMSLAVYFATLLVFSRLPAYWVPWNQSNISDVACVGCWR